MLLHSKGVNSGSTWLAALLSIAAPGLGHLYAGCPRRGLTLFTASVAALPASASMASDGRSVLEIVGPAMTFVLLSLGAAVDAARIAHRAGGSLATRRFDRRLVLGVLLMLGVAGPIASAWLIRETGREVYFVPTASMSPTIVSGDRIVGEKDSRLLRDLRRGDVVIFRPVADEGEVWVKRVIALAGDEISMHDGVLRLNGRDLEYHARKADRADGVLEERHPDGTRYEVTAGHGEFASRFVPPDCCFVLGDNRPNACDSRFLGPIALRDLEGLVTFLLLPADGWDRFGSLKPVRLTEIEGR